MYRGPFFLQHYLGGALGTGGNAYSNRGLFATYKKMLEYYCTGITANIGEAQLGSDNIQGGFAGRSIPIPTVQNEQSGQTLSINVNELVGRPVATVHNMWIDGISDSITGLTHYHGLVSGSFSSDRIPQRIFSNQDSGGMALEPSPAWEVAEFLIIALDRSGARVEGAVMALGCIPSNKIGMDIFNYNNQGQSALQTVSLNFNCQFVQSSYVNDLATRYVRQFAVFGNALNFNPGAGDAFFTKGNTTGMIDTPMFNNGNRPDLDAVQTGVGNNPVFRVSEQAVQRESKLTTDISANDHSRIYNSPDAYRSIEGPFVGNGIDGRNQAPLE
jgi:hypothetical protein